MMCTFYLLLQLRDNNRLDAMGGKLKSEDETEAYKQEREDLERLGKAVPSHRLTAMFSATMPSEVERIAKRYLRHPVIVSVGDQEPEVGE